MTSVPLSADSDQPDETARAAGAEPAAELPVGGRFGVLRNAALVIVAVFFANVSNYLFQVVMGRALGPAEYSLLASVFTLVAIASVTASALQAACAKSDAVRTAHLRPISGPVTYDGATGGHLAADPVVRLVAAGGAALGVLTAIASPLLGHFFHSTTGPVIGFAALLPSIGLLSLVFGRLQGHRRFGAFALLAAALAIAKLAVGVALGAAGAGVTLIMLSLAVTSAVGAVIGLQQIARYPALPRQLLFVDAGRGLVAFSLFWVLLSIDVLFARHWLPANDAGQYAAGSVIGKGILWLPDVVALVVFPQLAASRATGGSKKLVLRAASASAALCLLGCLALRVIGDFVFRHLYGGGYEKGADLSWKIGLVCIPLALSNLLVFFHLARSGWRWLIVLAGSLAAELVLFALHHDTATEILDGLAVSAVLLFVLLMGYTFVSDRS